MCSSDLAVIGVGTFLILGVTFSSEALCALCIGLLGACAGTAYITGFTILQEHVTEDLRGRTFASLAAVVRLCLLLSLTVAPLLADVADWLARNLIPNQEFSFGGFNYGFPGVRFALWFSGAVVLIGGFYARHELVRLGREEAARTHPTRPGAGAVADEPNP